MTQGLSKSDEQVVIADPETLGQTCAECHFRLFRVFRFNIAPTVRDAVNMRVYTDPRFLEAQSHNQVGGFPAHALKGQEFIYVVRDSSLIDIECPL